jgi:glycyl-tRNA synthetase
MKEIKNKTENSELMEKIISLCKRRGFIFAGSEIYGGLANSWDYGPFGVELKNNIKKLWWKMFVHDREDMYGLDAAIIMNRKVWKASGHESGFNDPLVECKKCHQRFKADAIEELNKCSLCGGELTTPKQFNMMFKTHAGAIESDENLVYLRPETAQGMFVNFKNILDTMSPKLPFGIAQIGKAFRNEITPGNFIFRTREFEQMEIEYFINPNDDWNKKFEYWLLQIKNWIKLLGINEKNIYFDDVEKDKLAHYSKRTVDITFDFPFGKKELYGLAYRTDFDLKAHQEESGERLEYFDQETKERFTPHVIEPSLGVDRTFLAVLVSAYKEDEVGGEKRVYLDFNFDAAPCKVAVFPLLSNKKDLVDKAREVYDGIKKLGIGFVMFDGGGNIGKRYRKQDEIGTPYCVTVDFDTLKDNSVTVRNRNTAKQERVKISELIKVFK